MQKILIRTAALLLLVCVCAVTAAAAEDVINVTLARGERWTVPADRLGKCAISDPAVLALEDGQFVGLRPGRAEAVMTGAKPTTFRVLVLFQEAEAVEDADPAGTPAADTTDVHYYAVSDSDEIETPVIDETGDADDEPETDPAAGEAGEADLPDPEEVPVTAEDPEQEEEAEPTPESEEPEAPASAEADADPSQQAYDRAAVPDAINTVIDFAIEEWRAAGNKAFSRAGSKNKYSFWQCGKGAKCNIGWCGAFLGYVFDTCGVPMDEPTKSVPHESGEPYSVRAAGVGKINKGFEKMNRLSMTPKPGYLVVYGQRRGYGYKHIGLLTDVDDLGDGKYLLKTVEGNMSNRIKRYCYIFDSNESVRNTSACPEEYRLDNGEINDYQHIKDWNITTFCQTWF